ncbi:MAG: hypothetical protein ACE5FJ_00260 [Gemmatimonadales bacterium]
MHSISTLPPLLLCIVLAAACDHTEPFDAGDTVSDTLIPGGSVLPRRLTFNQGDDGIPSVAGDYVAYGRQPIPHPDRDWCIAFIPLTGGKLTDETVCPAGGNANGIREAWLQPTVSPSGASVAFVQQIGDTAVTALVPQRTAILTAPRDDLSDTTTVLDMTPLLFRIQGPFAPVDASTVHRIQWSDEDHLLFIAGNQRNLLGSFCCDTLYVPMGLIELDLTDGTWSKIDLGPLPPFDYVRLNDGRIMFTEAEDPQFDRPGTPCEDEAPACPQNRIMVRRTDGTVSEFASLDGFGNITRLFGAGDALYAMVGNSVLWSVNTTNGVIENPSAPFGNLGASVDLQALAVAPALGLGVARADLPDGRPSNLWLIGLD